MQKTAYEESKLDFPDWLKQVSPTWTWDWPHLTYVQQYLNKLTRGDISRLMIFMPPRHVKTEMTTVRYAAWRLEIDPTLKIIIGAYNQTLANKFSRKARRIVAPRLELITDRQDEWETAQGGGVKAVGVGAGITGHGGDLIIIDDPVKSREEANSETYRNKVWDWYTDDLYSRRDTSDVSIILIMTRWHEDDLAGRILASDKGKDWSVINLPAEAEENDPLGREVGAALWPEKFDKAALEDIKATMGLSYYALYQQRPQPPEGGMFKRGWFGIVDGLPGRNGSYVRYWDKAATADGGSYTVGVLMASMGGLYYVIDVQRGQWSSFEREERIKQTAAKDANYGNVRIYIEQEPGSGGKDSAQATIRNLAGYVVRADRPSGDKATRAEPYAAQAEAGNVALVRGKWNYVYLEELAAFPYGTHNDQVDASSGAFNKLVKQREPRQYRYA